MDYSNEVEVERVWRKGYAMRYLKNPHRKEVSALLTAARLAGYDRIAVILEAMKELEKEE